MTDIHCHILPFVDDGADSMEDAVEMARMAADSGVTAIIATPHCNLPYGEEKNYISRPLRERFFQLQQAVKAAGIPLTILPGCEVLCTPDTPELLRQGKLLTLAGSRYLLVEFFFDEELSYMDEMLSAVAQQGFVPVVAHPERYEAVHRNPRIVERWFQAGYVIQLNKGSILGRLGRRAAWTAEWILSRGLAHVVASDAHSPVMRTTEMSEVTQFLCEVCSPEYADILLNVNPGCILRDRPILAAE